MPNAYSRHPATMTPEPPKSASFLAFMSCSSLDPILVGDDAECVVGPLTVNNNNPGDFVSSSGNFFDLASYFSAVLRLDQRGLKISYGHTSGTLVLPISSPWARIHHIVRRMQKILRQTASRIVALTIALWSRMDAIVGVAASRDIGIDPQFYLALPRCSRMTDQPKVISDEQTS